MFSGVCRAVNVSVRPSALGGWEWRAVAGVGGPSGLQEVSACGRLARGRGCPGTVPDRAQLPARARPPWVGFLGHPLPRTPGP